ncbi:MAG: hypothetical protein ACFE95_15790 [Candidatus Hodarchaeota archaeon]
MFRVILIKSFDDLPEEEDYEIHMMESQYPIFEKFITEVSKVTEIDYEEVHNTCIKAMKISAAYFRVKNFPVIALWVELERAIAFKMLEKTLYYLLNDEMKTNKELKDNIANVIKKTRKYARNHLDKYPVTT